MGFDKFLAQMDKEKIFWSCLVAGGALFVWAWLSLFGNKDQVYNDIVIENLAKFGSNKTVEVQLLYILILAGCLACLLWHLYRARQEPLSAVAPRNPISEPSGFYLCGVFVIPLAFYLSYGRPHQLVFVLLGLGLLALGLIYGLYRPFLSKNLLLPLLCLAFSGFYGVLGCYRFYVFAGGERTFNITYALVPIALLAVLVLAYRGDKAVLIGRAILVSQLALPGLYLYLLQDKYRQGAKTFIIQAPLPVQLFAIALVAASLLEALGRVRRYWQSTANLDSLIGLGGCAAIMSFNHFSGNDRYIGYGCIMPWDMRHPYENIIGFQQIFQLGQTPFQEYIPISGLYSVVHGAFVEFFGQGLFANYSASTNVFSTIIVLITVLLLAQRLRRSYLLFIAVYLYTVTDYDRTIFVLPLLLLLSWPQLIDRKGLWLQSWLLSSFLHGLYYPLQGAAVGLAFLPLALWQAYTYVQSGQLGEASRKFSFYLGWALCLLPILAASPILLGEAKHTLALSSQTVLADGMARFGQILPDHFLPYMKAHPVVRITSWYLLSFLVPALFVWVSLHLSLEAGRLRLAGRGIRIERLREACTCLALVIMPPVAYTFSIIRLEPGHPYNRASVTLASGALMLIVLAYHYVEGKKLFYALCCFAFLIPSLTSNLLGFYRTAGKLSYFYRVPRDYLYVQDEAAPKFGRGFVRADVYRAFQKGRQRIQKLDKQLSYLGLFPAYGYYYLCDIRGAGTLEIDHSVKGYGAALETVGYMRANRAAIGTGYDPVMNYYFHNWLLTSGEYYFDEATQAFYYNDGQYAYDRALMMNKRSRPPSTNGSSWLAYASSLGASMDSLAGIFTSPEVRLTRRKEEGRVSYDLHPAIDGQEADFLYLEFADPLHGDRQVLDDVWKSRFIPQGEGPVYRYFTRKHYNYGKYVTVGWLDDEGKERSLRCAMGKGKLLLPLGSGSNWLLHKHSRLTVGVDERGRPVAVPAIKKAQLLRLRRLPSQSGAVHS